MRGIVRYVDNLGRIVIPKEMRNALHIVEGTQIDISINGNTIVVEKYKPDRLEEKVREMQNILEQQIDDIGLEKATRIEKALHEIQDALE